MLLEIGRQLCGAPYDICTLVFELLYPSGLLAAMHRVALSLGAASISREGQRPEASPCTLQKRSFIQHSINPSNTRR